MGLEATGTIHEIFEAKQITERFRKREFVLTVADNPEYPQYVLFQLTGNRCDSIEGFQKGDEVRVEFSLRGREWTSPKNEVRYFNSLDVWAVEKVDGGLSSDAPPYEDEEPPF